MNAQRHERMRSSTAAVTARLTPHAPPPPQGCEQYEAQGDPRRDSNAHGEVTDEDRYCCRHHHRSDQEGSPEQWSVPPVARDTHDARLPRGCTARIWPASVSRLLAKRAHRHDRADRANRGRSGRLLNGHRLPSQNRTVLRTPVRPVRPRSDLHVATHLALLAPRVRHPVLRRDHWRQVHQVVGHVVCEEVGFLFRHDRVRAGRETFDQGAAHPSLNGDPTLLFGARSPSEDAHGDTLVTPARDSGRLARLRCRPLIGMSGKQVNPPMGTHLPGTG